MSNRTQTAPAERAIPARISGNMFVDEAVTFADGPGRLVFLSPTDSADRYLPMWELERDPFSEPPAYKRLTIIGRGRLGTALVEAFALAGLPVAGPFGRDAHDHTADADVVLLCVPDAEIAHAAALIAPGALLGHCSGATKLDVLFPREAFSMHPLMTVTGDGASFAGAGAAIAGSTARALRLAGELAARLGMTPVEIAEEDRAGYHAAASIASNFLITLEAAAERLAGGVGVKRELLVPLVRATVENWARSGAERALTGPVARGDEATVAAQRAAVASSAPDLLALFDALVEATRQQARRSATSETLPA